MKKNKENITLFDVKVTKEHGGVPVGSVIHVEKILKNHYKGTWSSMVGSYVVKVDKNCCELKLKDANKSCFTLLDGFEKSYEIKTKDKTFVLNIPTIEELSVKTALQEWCNIVENKAPIEQRDCWKELPQVPGYKFKNLKILNVEFPEMSKDSDGPHEINLNFTYDVVEKINNKEE